MGCGPSKSTKEEVLRDRRIAKELRRDFSKDAQIVKLLLLGAGESGKSTIVKQMKLLHPVNNRKIVGFSETERLESKNAIYANILDSMVQLLEALDQFGIKLGNNYLEADRDQVLTFSESVEWKKSSRASSVRSLTIDDLNEQMRPDQSVCAAISRLWSSPAIKECYNRRNEFQIDDSAAYFLDEVTRVCEPNFLPTDQDVLHTRVRTTGIVKIEFEYRDIVFNMYDVGGQRSERKKWIHCFDNVTAILFIISMSEYDQVLAEDKQVNRMHESLQLFSTVANNEFLHLKPFIVFFNKSDLFREKIMRKSIQVAFPDYVGPQTFEDSRDFIIDKYLLENKTSSNKRHIYTHVTTATDTELVKYVFNSVAEIILNEILRETGLN